MERQHYSDDARAPDSPKELPSIERKVRRPGESESRATEVKPSQSTTVPRSIAHDDQVAGPSGVSRTYGDYDAFVNIIDLTNDPPQEIESQLPRDPRLRQRYYRELQKKQCLNGECSHPGCKKDEPRSGPPEKKKMVYKEWHYPHHEGRHYSRYDGPEC